MLKFIMLFMALVASYMTGWCLYDFILFPNLLDFGLAIGNFIATVIFLVAALMLNKSEEI